MCAQPEWREIAVRISISRRSARRALVQALPTTVQNSATLEVRRANEVVAVRELMMGRSFFSVWWVSPTTLAILTAGLALAKTQLTLG